jgi:uncharacterized membrane protein (UPF0127 family)
MVLINVTKHAVVSDRCLFANSVLKRMVGLLNRKALAASEGLLIDRCCNIHTFGMRFPIDVVFLDHGLRVLRTVGALRPWRTCAARKAVYVLELPAGSIERSRIQAGDQIQISDTLSTPLSVQT